MVGRPELPPYPTGHDREGRALVPPPHRPALRGKRISTSCCRFCSRSVGLVQRRLEASGIATVTLSWMPDLTRAVGVPRLAGIGYPLSRPLGRPHDAEG